MKTLIICVAVYFIFIFNYTLIIEKKGIRTTWRWNGVLWVALDAYSRWSIPLPPHLDTPQMKFFEKTVEKI